MRQLVIVLCLLLNLGYSFSQGYFRIINGSSAKPKQIPYQAGLHCFFSNSLEEPNICGGTIISNRWILTAAHCLQEPDITLVKVIVIVGTIKMKNKKEPGRVQLVVKRNATIVHPRYDRNTVGNDIGLIHLPKDLKFNAYAQPAKLPKSKDKNSFNDRFAISSGWGLTDSQDPSDLLQYIKVRIISNKQCEQKWNEYLATERKLVLDSFVCVDSRGGLPCRGDSGGPLVLNDGSLTVVGIVSHGYDVNCQIRLPDIFTRVSSFTNWIEQYTGRLNNA